MEFEALRLVHGATLQVQVSNSAGQPERYSCRYVGAVAGRTLIFTMPRGGGKTPRFRPGQRVAVRLMIANGIGLFAASVEAQSTEPLPLLYVSYPDSVTFKGIRSATRVVVNQDVTVVNDSQLDKPETSGRIADISINGARLELREPIANIGDKVILKSQVTVEGQTWPLAIESVIRSRIERSTQEQHQTLAAVYGVEFTEQNKDALLVLHAYVFSHIAAEQTPQNAL
ncbi:flagellar brake domain-containing protein [Gilvimarinus chinensis]|uniref:flagellar brake domain-containing protein n=1 Tax=Gilvimarinus chinensis TaxID=396005 RepID=UPI000364B5DE|nr:flagellar brake protein [Gilvimarinus chinensis]